MFYNTLICSRCKDVVISLYRHDFYVCECGQLYIDGGFDYARIGHKDQIKHEDLKLPTKQQVYAKVKERVRNEVKEVLPLTEELTEELESFHEKMNLYFTKDVVSPWFDKFDGFKGFKDTEKRFKDGIQLRNELILNVDPKNPVATMVVCNLSPLRYSEILIGEVANTIRSTAKVVPRFTEEQKFKKLMEQTTSVNVLSLLLSVQK